MNEKINDLIAEIGSAHAMRQHPEIGIKPDCTTCEYLALSALTLHGADMNLPPAVLEKALDDFDFAARAELYNAQRG